MRKSKGFTLIELMVVILIVAILAAVLAPMMTGRIRQAKWTEGKTGAGTIATALRAFFAENEGWSQDGGVTTYDGSDLAVIGIEDVDLTGKYFTVADYAVTGLGTNADGTPDYLITVSEPATIGTSGDQWTLDETGTWTKL